MLLPVNCFLMMLVNFALSAPGQGGARNNIMRLAREDKSLRNRQEFIRLLNDKNLNSCGELLGYLDKVTGGQIVEALDNVDGTAILGVISRANLAKQGHPSSPKRTQTLDTLNGMAFGMNKRFDSLSGSTFGLNKRDFDEIDNVGFTGFAKRGPYSHNRLALAKKNFDEIDRAGFETYNKRNFDEIDRAGFETFEKRDRKE